MVRAESTSPLEQLRAALTVEVKVARQATARFLNVRSRLVKGERQAAQFRRDVQGRIAGEHRRPR